MFSFLFLLLLLLLFCLEVEGSRQLADAATEEAAVLALALGTRRRRRTPAGRTPEVGRRMVRFRLGFGIGVEGCAVGTEVAGRWPLLLVVDGPLGRTPVVASVERRLPDSGRNRRQTRRRVVEVVLRHGEQVGARSGLREQVLLFGVLRRRMLLRRMVRRRMLLRRMLLRRMLRSQMLRSRSEVVECRRHVVKLFVLQASSG